MSLREGNYVQVRIAAFDALFLTRWYTPKIVRYILAVIANDPSRIIRRHVARNASQSLALLVTMGELKDSKKESESLLIEEDGATQEKVKENKRSEVDQLVKALRKDKEVGKNEVLREFLLPIILYVSIVSPLTRLILRAMVELRTQITKFGGLFSNSSTFSSGVQRRFHRSLPFIFPLRPPSPRRHRLCPLSRSQLSSLVVLLNLLVYLLGARSCRQPTLPKSDCSLERPVQMPAPTKCRLLRMQRLRFPSTQRRMLPSRRHIPMVALQ